jgi:SAM-dependent methyltransferase
MHMAADRAAMFERLVWRDDRVLLDDLVFRLQHTRNDAWELGEQCFVFYKIQPLIDQYARFWATRAGFRPQNVFELGLWDGGSLAFWFELFQPRKHVGVDLARRDDSDYFRRYVGSRGLEQRIATYWGVDQADAERIRHIVRDQFAAPLDLVIDDASHMYRPTKASFEALFPCLRPGGLYVIEDWAWAHWKEFQTQKHPWITEPALTRLIFELIAAAGSSPSLIANIAVFQGFTVIERGDIAATALDHFKLEQYISNRPPASITLRMLRASKRYARRLLRRK